MKLRLYGNIKAVKTDKPITGVIIKLYLNEEEIKKDESAKNGFYEIIAEIDDSLIESGQHFMVTFEKSGYQKQEHRVFSTEDTFNMDVELEELEEPEEVSAPVLKRRPINWLPVIIGGAAVLVLLVIGVIASLLISNPKLPDIISFSADPNSIESGQSATLNWETKNVSSVKIDPNIGEVESKGYKQVKPIKATRYLLTARNRKGDTKTQSLRVNVSDNFVPEITITHSPENPTVKEKLIFTANAKDPSGIKNIEIIINDEKVKECPDPTCIFEPKESLGPGVFMYWAIAYDKAGNKGTSDRKSLKVVDVDEPSVTITHAPSVPNTTQNITFTANAKDPGGIIKLEIYVNNNKVKECSDTSCKFISKLYPVGNITYWAIAYDKLGNKGSSDRKTLKVIENIDAVMYLYYKSRSRSYAYYFKRQKWFRYRPPCGNGLNTYGGITDIHRFEGLTFKKIDAAINWDNGKAYFFKGDEYIQYNISESKSERKVDQGFPQKIKNGWPGLTFKKIDAAINWGNGKAYFFSDDEYIQYDIRERKVDPGFPQKIENSWPGFTFKKIDAATNCRNGKALFFSDDEYIQYDIKGDKADPGFPKKINKTWPGLKVSID